MKPPLVDPADVPALRLDMPRVVLFGTACWVVALVVTLLVPALHRDDRDWWPMACAAGVALGALGYAYLRRGRADAAAASR